jgi:hypothetical protein
MRRACPYRGENNGPGKEFTESLTPRPELENDQDPDRTSQARSGGKHQASFGSTRPASVPNPKFAIGLAARECELRVRGTRLSQAVLAAIHAKAFACHPDQTWRELRAHIWCDKREAMQC